MTKEQLYALHTLLLYNIEPWFQSRERELVRGYIKRLVIQDNGLPPLIVLDGPDQWVLNAETVPMDWVNFNGKDRIMKAIETLWGSK